MTRILLPYRSPTRPQSGALIAVTVGVATPLITMLVLTRTDIDFRAHENDLITYFSGVLNGPWFAYAVGALASFTLIMAVNTAFVASSVHVLLTSSSTAFPKSLSSR